MTIKDYRYIYNTGQALFYISMGLSPIESKTHNKTNNIYFKFKDSERLQEVFRLWMDKKNNRRQIKRE